MPQGQREAQFKIVGLQYLKELDFDFFTWQAEEKERKIEGHFKDLKHQRNQHPAIILLFVLF